MKIQGNAIRPGNVLLHEGRLWRVHKIQHVKPGKGGAFNQVELKNIEDGTKRGERFRSDAIVERARLEERAYQYLYSEGDLLALMQTETFEQISLPAELVGESLPFLAEGMEVTVESHEGRAIAASLPEQAVVVVAETEPVIKGQTATGSYKPATLENGVRTMVPPHVDVGQRVVVRTADGEYVERARD